MDVIPLVIIILFVVILGSLFVMWILKLLKGKIVLSLDKYSFAPGEEVSGNINLKLRKNVESKGLKIGLVGYKREVGVNRRGSSSNMPLYDFYQPIDGEKTYNAGESNYNFKIKIPSDILSKTGIQNDLMAGAVKAVQILQGTFSSYIEWYIVATLDVSGLDITKQIKINISS